jgi:hypothetical protein
MNEKIALPDPAFRRGRPSTAVRDREGLAVLVNLVVFALCAALAFGRNTLDLFGDFDGRFVLVELSNRLTFTPPRFTFSNDFLQSVGNIEFLTNPWVFFVYWPLLWFSDLDTSRLVVYLFIAVIVFLSAYGLSRLLSLGRYTALMAGWILGVVVTPFVPYPFICPILSIAPTSFLLVVSPVVGFWLVRQVGQATLTRDALAGFGLVVFLLYLLVVCPPALPLLAAGAVPYAIMALLLIRRRSELVRIFAVLAAVMVIAACLRWPWYLLGLFSYSAPLVFPDDFTLPNLGAPYLSILFQGRMFGWAGPTLVVASAMGALLSLHHSARELRVAAHILMVFVVSLLGARVSYSLFGDWSRFSPFYLEIALWPLYAVFSAVLVQRTVGLVAAIAVATTRLLTGKEVAGAGARAGWLLPATAPAVAALLATSQSPLPKEAFPPRNTAIVDVLKSNIALGENSTFKGRVATIIPVDAKSPDDPWLQQLTVALKVWRTIGNDQLSIGLWYYRIPTLFEYNQFLSPVFHALVRRTLQRPVLPHTRNIEIFSHADARILRLLGVRYVIMLQAENPIGVLRATEEVAGQRWGLYELSAPNLASYSATAAEVRRGLAETLDFVADDFVDLTKAAVVHEEIGGPLTPVASSSLSMSGGDLHVVAKSAGRSLLIVPVEFSHCMELQDKRTGSGGPKVRLVRADGVLTGVVFERELDAVLAFRTGPLHSPTCRWKDYQELQTMLR